MVNESEGLGGPWSPLVPLRDEQTKGNRGTFKVTFLHVIPAAVEEQMFLLGKEMNPILSILVSKETLKMRSK